MRRFVAAAVVGLTLQGFMFAGTSVAGGAPSGQVRSRFTVTVPAKDAELIVEGVTARGSGATRVVQTGPLEKGKRYEHTLVVKWWPNGYTHITRTKTVEFVAGQAVRVDLTRDEGRDRAEVRYYATPEYIVNEMIKLAGIGPDDVVYELGCGDARTTIAAVKAGAKRGVGIDIDPARVAESRQNVNASGLSDRIEVRQGDVLDIRDLSDATVVLLYMGNEFNMLLRPILWRQLRVGARVVSHAFNMGDWTPDTTVGTGGDLGYLVHLWTITNAVKEKAAS